MPAQFTPDKGSTPTRFRPSAGMVGASSAEKALKHPGGGGGNPQPKKARPSQGAKGHSLGLPPSQEPQPTDGQDQQKEEVGRMILQYLSSLNLGRGQPFGVWANRTGHSLNVMEPGQRPYDVFTDLPAGY